MADLSKFRSSLGGFNRSDVVNYIEESSYAHQKELRSLKDANAKALAENEDLQEKLALAQTERDLLQAECDQLRAEMAKLQEEDASLQQQIEALALEASSLVEQAASQEEEEAAEEPVCNLNEMELEAYRRAEAMERNATLRAERLNNQLGALCENVRSRCQDSGEEISALRADLSAVLERLQEAVADACVIFEDTEDAFDQIQLPEALMDEG